MKKAIIWIIIIAFVLSGLTAAVFSQPSTVSPAAAIKVAPAAPRFTDAERHAELARRRAAVASKMADNSILILFPAEPKLYTNDVDYVYRQENNLVYLTGLKQNGAMLVLRKQGDTITETLFLPKRNPQYEAWNGKMYSNEEAAAISGLRTIVPASERAKFIESVKANAEFVSAAGGARIAGDAGTIYLLLPEDDSDHNGKREYRQEQDLFGELANRTVANARPIFDELRQVKSPYEIKLLQHAIDITNEAHMRAMAMAGTAKWEYEVQAEVEYTFRRRGADYWGFPSIVGCGPNGTTLHYQVPSGAVTRGDLITLDIGAEYEHYTADVTRTFPVNGKFTKEQAEIYRIVFDAQEAVARATKPGVRFSALQITAARAVEDGLFRVGLITKKDGRQFRMWYFHGFGHWLGMNVHDVSNPALPLAPGMVFTNEPGVYIREDALDYLADTPENREFIAKVRPVFEKYKNIGVRIEDDLLVTADGVEWMTKDLPRSIADVEAFMARARTEARPLTFDRTLSGKIRALSEQIRALSEQIRALSEQIRATTF